MEKIEIAKIIPASYNPRKLNDDAFETLKESITKLGVLKPILVNGSNNVIIAGHQRTKTMKALGITHAFGYVLHGLNEQDEVRFNQIHNQCEYEVNPKAPKVKITASLKIGINRIRHSDIQVLDHGTLSIYANILSKMMSKYGEFAAPICTEDGEVIVSAGYARVAKLMHRDIDVFVVENEKRDDVIKFFGKSYGEFCYENLPRNTYMQTFAQMFRLRDGKSGKQNNSTLYMLRVIPYLHSLPNKGRDLKILDFGAGMYDFAMNLERMGYNIHYVDPYHRIKGSNNIDFENNRKRLIKVANDLRDWGGYDIVICDSVLNSVDSVEAEKSVINTCHALCKMNGLVFISGRLFEGTPLNESVKKSESFQESQVKFFDKDLFTAQFRNGAWFYQKFHRKEDVNRIARFMSAKSNVYFKAGVWHIVAQKLDDKQEAVAALRFEFNLQLPHGESYGLHDLIQESYENRNCTYD